jgi:BTB/POZ domain-containing protein 13
MGESLSKFLSDYCHRHVVATNIRPFVSMKRRRDESEGEDNDPCMLEKTLHTPKKKLLFTTQRIYRTLLKDGNNSDVTIIALGRQWKLHKVYLCQSPYFASMFSGAWRESRQDIVEIKITDPNINLDSLCRVLVSLYLGEITLEPAEVVPTLATATFFHLDGIIDYCKEIMIENMNADTAVTYYYAACEYGVKQVKEMAFKLLLVHPSYDFPERYKHLREISVDLMEKLVSHPDLIFNFPHHIYSFLRLWVFLQLHPERDSPSEYNVLEAKRYFGNRKDEEPLLLTREGKRFAGPFHALMLRYRLDDHQLVIQMLKWDRIVPQDWLAPFV